MNAKQMKQVTPVIERVFGWGDARAQEVTIIGMHCDTVTQFKLEKPEITDSGWSLIFTRIGYMGNLWTYSVEGSKGEAYLLDTDTENGYVVLDNGDLTL